VLLQDNVCLYTAACTRALLEQFIWELFDHSPYSPDLALSDYHLFTHTHLKNWLGSRCFNNNKELKEGIKMWLSSQADFFDAGTQKLIPQYDKCLSSIGDYAEK
jgi:histone-lysine N-methyltransferase SETMAR